METETWFVDRIPHPRLPLLVVVDEMERVVAVTLGVHPAQVLRHARRWGARVVADRHKGRAVRRELASYLRGGRQELTSAVRLLGTPFQVAAWDALRQISFGTTRTYGQQAAAMGRPSAVRAVGAANGANPVPILVPCHRVVGHDGGLTGFGGGLPLKRWLLDLESPQGLLIDPAAARSVQRSPARETPQGSRDPRPTASRRSPRRPRGSA
jgi:O-6-methylguanine DNA methyltransferase